MHFALTILGNNSALPAHGRMPTAQVVTFGDQLFLVDCGEGTQMQMSRYKIRRSKIHHIFISHLHGDHYFGLIGLLNSYGLAGRQQPLHIYASPELETILQLQLDTAATRLPYPLIFTPLIPGQTAVLLKEAHLEVSCFPTDHRISCFGFLFREIRKKRKLDIEKARQYEIPAYYYSHLQEGADYQHKNGSIVKNEWVTFAPPPGHSYAFCADTRYDEKLIPVVKGCDMLYHETTYLQEQSGEAAQRFHSTTLQAATLAQKAGVKKLLIGHFSSRYEELEPFREECRQIFPHTELALEGTTYLI